MEAAEDADPRAASAIRATSRCGRAARRPSSPRPRRGPRRTDEAGPAGTSSARRWRRSTSGRPSTSTAAGSTSSSRTTRTSWRSRGRPADVRVVLAAQRVDHHGRREDVEVAGQLDADPRGGEAGARHRARATTWSRRTTARTSSSRFEALDEAATVVPADRELRRPGEARSVSGRRTAWCAPSSSRPSTTTSVRRRPRGDPRRRDRGQQAASGEATARRCAGAWRRCWRCSACSASIPTTRPGRGSAARTTRSSPPRSTRSSPVCSRSGPLRGRARTGPRADAIRDRIAGRGHRRRGHPRRSEVDPGCAARAVPDAGQQPAQGRDPQDVEEADRRVRWSRPPRARGQGTDPQGGRPAQPQGAQGARRGPSATRRGVPSGVRRRRRRVGRRPQLGGRGAAGRRTGDRALRRRGRRARRPAA